MEVVVLSIKVLSQHLHGGTNEKALKPKHNDSQHYS